MALPFDPQLAAMAAGHYFHWGVMQVSLANLLIILSMIALLVAALLVRFPRDEEPAEPPAGSGAEA